MRVWHLICVAALVSAHPAQAWPSDYINSTSQPGHDRYPRGSGHTSQQVQDRCVVVLATGRSGSTQLVDSLNQLPNYFIRGEQAGAFWHFYLTLRYLLAAWGESHEFARAVDTWHRSRMPFNETGGPRYGAQQHPEPVEATLAAELELSTQSAGRQEGSPGPSIAEGGPVLQGHSGSLGYVGQSTRDTKAGPAAAAVAAAVSLDARGATTSAEALFLAAAEAAAKARVTPGDSFHRSLSYPTFDRVKALYGSLAADRKMPWFNDLEPGRLYDAVRAFYSVVYGYHGPGVVSGFKEIRFVCGRAFPAATSTYDDFAAFLAFLRLMCKDVKILLNTRRSPDMDSNDKLLNMLSRLGGGNAAADTEATGVAPAIATDTAATHDTPTHDGGGTAAGGRDVQTGPGQQASEARSISSSAYLTSNQGNTGAANEAVITNSTNTTDSAASTSSSTGTSMSPRQRLASFLAVTHTWFDRYASEHPRVAMRVLMEDMFTPGVNLTLSRRLLSFLGEDPSALTLRFDRMPSWGARSKRHTQGRGGGAAGGSRGSSRGSGHGATAPRSTEQGHVGAAGAGGRHGVQPLDLPLINELL